jgi:DNA-3-methyladenine glycosylase
VTRNAALPDAFFRRTAPEVARDLLGAVIVSRIGGRVVSGYITETEAYLGHEDPASHAWRGRRHAGNEGIYSPPGFWYVYRSYGIHWCANLVTAPEATGAAVLLRGLLPASGIEIMRRRRHRPAGDPAAMLVDGPGKLTQALGMDRTVDRRRMRTAPVVVTAGVRVPDTWVETTPRIGITRATDWPLRFFAREVPTGMRTCMSVKSPGGETAQATFLPPAGFDV